MKKGERMRLTKEAVESLTDTYKDRLIDAHNKARREALLYFPGELIRECKAISEELEWAKGKGWITEEEAARTWEAVERNAGEWLESWEAEEDD